MRLPPASRPAVALAAVLSLLPVAARAQSEPSPEILRPVTLADAVTRAIESNLALAVERFNRDTSREAVNLAEAGFDPVLGVIARKTYREESVPSTTVSSSLSDTERGSVTVSKLVETGATVTVAGNTQRQEQDRIGVFNPQYDSDVSLRVVQPLLRGAGTGVNRATRRRALIGVDRSDETFKSRALDTVQGAELAFYDLAYAVRNLDVQLSGLATAEKFLQENEARQRAGLATELDVMQSRVGVANRKAQIIAAERRVRDAADALEALLGTADFTGRLEPVDVVLDTPAPGSFEGSYPKALENDPDIRTARLLLRQLELDIRLAGNQRLPRVDLGGTLGFTGRDRTFDGAVGFSTPEPGPSGLRGSSLTSGDNYNWQVDLSVNIPWGAREGRARERSARLTFEQQETRIEQLEQDLLVRVRNAVRAVQSDAQTVEINVLTTELASREYQLEKAKFDAGLSTSRLVVEAQQREDEARIRETLSRVQLRQNAARLTRLEGRSLEAYGIRLPTD